jgi:hypothetical protein
VDRVSEGWTLGGCMSRARFACCWSGVGQLLDIDDGPRPKRSDIDVP